MGIPVKYLSGKLLTVGKKNQLRELVFIVNLIVLVRFSELVIPVLVRGITAFCPVEVLYNCNCFFLIFFPCSPL